MITYDNTAKLPEFTKDIACHHFHHSITLISMRPNLRSVFTWFRRTFLYTNGIDLPIWLAYSCTVINFIGRRYKGLF